MNDERAVKAKNFAVDGSKKGRLKKRWKEAIEKKMLARGSKKSNAQDRAVWRLGCKNKSNRISFIRSLFSALLQQTDDDDWIWYLDLLLK